jgi:hypothetical protein
MGAGQTIGNYSDTDEFTVELWVRRNPWVVARAIGTRWDEANVTFVVHSGWSLSATAVGTTFSYFNSGLRGDIQFDTIIDNGQRAHLVATYTAGEGTRVFLDGVQQGVVVPNDDSTYIRPHQPHGQTGPPQYASTPAYFEITGNGDPGFFAVYQTALTPAQIERHYRAGTGPILNTLASRAHSVPIVERETPALGVTHRWAHQPHIVTAPPHQPTLYEIHGGQHVVGLAGFAAFPELAAQSSKGHLSAPTYVRPAIPVPPGKVARAENWQQSFTGELILPFRLLAGDWIALTCVHLAGAGSGSGGTLPLTGFTIREAGSLVVWDSLSTNDGVFFCEVVDATNHQSIQTDPDFHVSASIVVYRGVGSLHGPGGSDMYWGAAIPDKFSGVLPGMTYESPYGTGLCVRALYLSWPPTLLPVHCEGLEGGPGDVVQQFTIDPEELDDYGERLNLIIHEEAVVVSPTSAWTVYSSTAWDYALYNYTNEVVHSHLVTVIFVPSLGPLETQLDNPAPLGAGRYPIGTIGGAPDPDPDPDPGGVGGLLTEDGLRLTTEAGDILTLES